MVSSIGLLWPLPSFRFGARVAQLIGFDGFQAAPMRGIPTDDSTTDYLKTVAAFFPIYLVEGSWIEQGSKPDFLAQLIFGSGLKSAVRHLALTHLASVRQVVHHLDEVEGDALIEAHPGLGLSPFEFITWARINRHGIAFDTLHCRTGKAMTGTTVAGELWANWAQYIDQMAELIEAVHFQPKRDGGREFIRWLLGQPTELGKIVTKLQSICPRITYWVVELPPPIGPMPKETWKKFPWAFWTYPVKCGLWTLFSPMIHWLALRKLRHVLSE